MGVDLASVWARRPAKAVARLGGRQLLVLSPRDLLRAAAREDVLLVALAAPAPAAIAGFTRAARDAEAPLLLVRPSGADEKGPEEARDDAAFTDAAFRLAGDLHFRGPMALLKDPPRAGSAVPDPQRVQAEIDAGFTGVSLAAADTQQDARNAALTASAICQMELGLEIVPLGGARAAAELARQLRSRGAPPSAVRITGMEEEAAALADQLGDTALSTATESAVLAGRPKGLRQLIASGPFLRALRRAVPAETWETLQAWADEKQATPEQSASHHQRLLRDLPPAVQDRLEALCCFEALDLFRKAGARGTSRTLIAALAALHQGED